MPKALSRMDFPDIALLKDKLHFNPERAQIYLGKQRMIMMHLAALNDLRGELIASLGSYSARAILTRIGFSSGTRDAETALQLHAPGAAIFDLLARGPQLHALQGVALSKLISADLDVTQGRCRLEFLWEHSFEDEDHRLSHSFSSTPACWLQTGYASGFLSACMGKLILVREIGCRAMGHDVCHVIAQPASEWADPETELQFLNAPVMDHVPDFKAKERREKRRVAALPHEQSKGKSEIVGMSPAFQAVVQKINRVAPTGATALLLGESGVGKSALARLLHERSHRAAQQFVAINCAAIPESLMEAELFGVERGAFTGAEAARAGRFELAENGTLFLDEIATLPLTAQGKLLRVLETGEFERLGSGTARHADVRIIAATNEDLWGAVRAGHFREDLFFRLYVFPIQIPPLRQRKEDIPVLIAHFVERYSKAYDRQVHGLAPEAMATLLSYPWPGNIRELSNVLERAIILSDNDRPLDLSHVITMKELSRERTQTDHIVSIPSEKSTAEAAPALHRDEAEPDHSAIVSELMRRHGVTLAQMERTMVSAAVDQAGGNASRAAAILGITRGQLAYRRKQLAPS
ncbi:AAA domain-containing protein [Paraburkholderia sp. Ac-20336]|uniref:sigma-54-dependent Fis family transcriptional regulator n=1 Tax=Burkholderiaceae TaxID=119060 RepID=UPI00141F521B|nr:MULTISPECIES: sigma-54-dependent Fis family transcriptional regulator [Burkholderiaceae]MBN3804801.1 AAA domain-containing protein [Paraburkholderia sp. Ac-20336]MBN3845971.1 AAA domain-containing protein [Paraburkholderia sp. Ac-20342]NIF54110.1 AAA domain-containing protein [Burkholderia sp. Ax-1724]NIF77777.1 AAA domain-containing protein [Paraburkholderia sp. Cy-641]